MPYEVHTPVFEGPFDLLLHLILREQVELYDINLSEIVDAYLVELDRMERLDLEVATEFLLIAATLVELKARRLLPDDPEIDLDDELGLWEERDLLLARLVECKTFKDAALVFRRLTAHAARSYARRVGPERGVRRSRPRSVGSHDPRRPARRVPERRPLPNRSCESICPTSLPIKVTVEEAVEELVDELPRVGRVTFRELTAQLVDRIDVVVRFLAVLELFKQGAVELEQPLTFGDITVVWVADARTCAPNPSPSTPMTADHPRGLTWLPITYPPAVEAILMVAEDPLAERASRSARRLSPRARSTRCVRSSSRQYEVGRAVASSSIASPAVTGFRRQPSRRPMWSDTCSRGSRHG